MILIPSGWTNGHRGRESAEGFINRVLPSLTNHLRRFEAKARARDDRGDYWWELRPCAYYTEFEKEKVIYPNMATELQAALDENKMYCNQKEFIITGKHTKYITALLNSRTEFWYFKKNLERRLEHPVMR